jgi:hypothetical protein
VKPRIIPKYAQFEFGNDLGKSTIEILSYSPKVIDRNKDGFKKISFNEKSHRLN